MTTDRVPGYVRDLLQSDRIPEGAGPARPAVSHLSTTKTVAKHWGEERWLVPENTPFGFKIIHLRAGHRTSLQLHEKKEEANLILRGSGTLYFAETPERPVRRHPLSAGNIVHVRAGTVHRIEADTDITLVEVSTPELDDVIRLADDWNRSNGRIAAEHITGNNS
jgi:mannose-6-phosphate isomerase